MERVLTDINADYGDCGIEFLRHGVLLVFGAPGQLKMLAGQEHGRTIPLTDITRGPLALPRSRIHGISGAKRERVNGWPELGVPYRSQSLKATEQEQQ